MADAEQSVENAVQVRRAKLQALRAKRDASENKDTGKAEPPKAPVLKFRNYNPHTEELKNKKLPRTKPESVEDQVSEQLEAAKKPELGDVNLSNLAPKKPDWDLKRDIAKKLELLETRTQKAIIELIRDRLAEDSSDLAAAVASAQQHQETTDYD